MEKSKKVEYLGIAFYMFLGAAITLGTMTYADDVGLQINKILYEGNGDFDKVVNECSKEETFSDLFCIEEDIKINFEYTKPHKVPQDVEDTYTNGGACLDYTEMWIYAAKELGYGAKKVYVNEEDDVRHVFAVIELSEKGYCIADMDKLNCYITTSE